jgi:tape measure domain-containing protein
MAAAELKLNVTLDLAFFRQQLQKLTTIAQSEFAPQLKVKFDRSTITKELQLLDRSLKGKKYNLDIGTTSLDVAIKKAKELQQILSQPKGQTARAGALQGILGKESGRVIIKKDDVKNVYSAAIKAGIEGLSGNANQTRAALERELKAAFGGASDNALKGLINGLLKGEGELASAAKSLGKTVEQGLKAALEIRSPSKKTQRIGEQTADGFWLGLINNIAKGERSAATAIRSAVANAFRQGLSGAGEISGSMVAFERQLAEGVRRALAGAIVQALRDGMKGSISPGIKGTMVGGAGGFATGGLAAGFGAAKAAGAAGLAQLSQGGAGAGMQRAFGLLGGDTSGMQSFLAQGQEQVMNAVVQGGVQGAIVGAVGVAAVAGATGFAGGAAKSLFKQGVEAFMGSMLRTAYVTVRDLTTGTYLLGSAAATGLKTGDTQRAVGEVARALLNAGAETARNEGRALARQAGTGLVAGGRAAAGGIGGAFNAGRGGRERALQNAYDALISVLIKGAVDLQGLPDGTTIRALKQAVLSLKAAMEIASVQVSVAGEASRPGVRNMLRSGERANGARLSPIIGTVVEDLGNTKYLPRPGEGQSGRKIQEGLDNIAKAAAEAARQALNNQARAIANATRGVRVRDLGATGQPLLSGGRTAGLLPQGASYGRTPAPYGQAYNPYAITKYAGGGGGGGTGGGPGNVGAAYGGYGGGGGGGNILGQLSNIKLPGAGIVNELASEFANATKQVLLFGTAYKALAFAQAFPGQVMQAVGALQSYRNSLKAITPSSKEFAASNDYILQLVDKFNIPLQSARSGFIKLYASMAPAGFGGNEIRDLFAGISKAAATFGMSGDKVDRVTYAFAQMASKGQVMSEELKGQLGDTLPGALAIFSKAAGFKGPDAIGKFSKALEDGAYKGKSMVALLKNVTVVMNQEFGPGAEGAAVTFQGLMNRMANSTLQLYETFEPVAIGFANQVVVPLTNGIKTVADGFKAYFTGQQAATEGGGALAAKLVELTPTFQGLAANAKLIAEQLLNAAKVAGVFLEAAAKIAGNPLVGWLLKVYVNVLLLQGAFKLLGGQILLNLIQNIGAAIGRFVVFNAALRASAASATLTQSQMLLLSRSAGAAIAPINMLRGALMGLARFALITIAVQIVINGLAQLAEAQARIDRLRGARNPEGAAGPALIMTAQRRYTGASREKVTADQQKQVDYLAQLRQERKTLQATQTKAGGALGQTAVGNISNVLGGLPSENTKAKLTELDLRIKNAEEVINLNPRQFKTAAEQQRASVKATMSAIGGGGGGGKTPREKKERESQAAQLKLDLDLSKEQFALDLQMINAQLTANVIEQNRIEGAKEILDLQYQIKGVKLEQIPEDEKQLKITKLQGAIEAARAQSNAKLALAMTRETKAIEENIKKTVQGYQQELQEKQRYAELLSQGVAPALAKIYIEIERAFKEQKEQLKVQIGIAETAIIELEAKKDLTDEDKKRLGILKDQLKARKKLLGDADKGEKDSKGAAAQTQAPPSIATTLTEGLDAARQKLADLLDIGNMLVGAANAIGDAFGNAFKGLIDGSMTAQQAFASLFQNVANYFTDMVAQMIAEWLKAQLIKGFMNIIGMVIPGFGAAASAGGGFAGGASGFGGSFDAGIAPLPNIPNYSGAFTAANGGIAQGGFRAFASGGIVTGPTLGLVGEGRYNEAVIPLPDGKSVPVDLGGMGGGGNQITSNIVVNVSSDGQSQSQQSGTGNAELGRKIEGAVKQVIVGELRPGGLLAGRR